MKKLGLSLKPKYAGGKRTVRTEEFTEGIWSVCCSDPSMKMRKMAKHVEASRSTVRRAVREDLCLFPYKHRKTQLIPFKKRPVRVKRGMKILVYLEEHPDTIVLWSDEKQWNVDTTVNQQNDRYLAYCIQDVPEVHRTTRPAGAISIGLVDPIADNSEKFHGWSESDVNALQVKVDRKTLQRITLLDPDHYISDLSMVDINEMKCWELVKELKSRGLPSS